MCTQSDLALFIVLLNSTRHGTGGSKAPASSSTRSRCWCDSQLRAVFPQRAASLCVSLTAALEGLNGALLATLTTVHKHRKYWQTGRLSHLLSIVEYIADDPSLLDEAFLNGWKNATDGQPAERAPFIAMTV